MIYRTGPAANSKCKAAEVNRDLKMIILNIIENQRVLPFYDRSDIAVEEFKRGGIIAFLAKVRQYED